MDYIAKLVELRSQEPKDDLISKLVTVCLLLKGIFDTLLTISLSQEQVIPGHIERSDAVQIAFLMLVAGNATMVNMINLVSSPLVFHILTILLIRVQGIVTLLQHPDQLSKLKADPGLSPAFVSELCRYHVGSSYATRRVAKVDIELGGHQILAGEGIIAATQSASRDEDVFSDPEDLDILRFVPKENGGRGEDPYLAMGYGWGQHRCVAEPLARGELETVFGKQPIRVDRSLPLKHS